MMYIHLNIVLKVAYSGIVFKNRIQREIRTTGMLVGSGAVEPRRCRAASRWHFFLGQNTAPCLK